MIPKGLLHFDGQWRSYQKRILDNLEYHLRDKKLHVVAAPGAGKTTLGIEVIARMNRCALILCPTNTIKVQWRERICTSFLSKQDTDQVSTDIRHPKPLTVITYQALLAAFCGMVDNEQEEQDQEDEPDGKEQSSITASARFRQEKADEIIETLRKADITLLCFDEAHHLRREWWKALTYLNEHLKPEQTLALTATPPYDADMGEWKRYQELCGEIDEVISIPELVKNGDLCPHQDFIYLSPLRDSEQELLRQHASKVRTLIDTLLKDKALQDTLVQMPIWRITNDDVATIFDHTEYYVAMASLLHSTGHTVPRRFLALFDAEARELPPFNAKRATVLCNGLLGSEEEQLAPFRDIYMNMAKRLGLVINNRIVLDENVKIRRQIAGSIGKLDAIVDIVRLESRQLQGDLRMVILTDRIKRDDTQCLSIGVVPIWRKIIAECGPSINACILCGSLIVLSRTALGQFQQLLSQHGMDPDAVSLSPFDTYDNYVRLSPLPSVRNQAVSLITQMFNAGDITILVGTQALLGEGWDAPAINSLILSSTVSSYMLSNQMRGRAIRMDKHDPDKVSNIWHLASYYIPSPLDQMGRDDQEEESPACYNYDLKQLEERFLGFEAPAYNGKHEITSGMERIIDLNSSLAQGSILSKMIDNHHDRTLQLAQDRNQTRQWWQEALYLGHGNNQQPDLRTGIELETKKASPLQYKTYMYYAYVMAAIFGSLTIPLVRSYAIPVLGMAIIFAIMILVKYLKTGTTRGVMKQIAIVHLETLAQQGAIRTTPSRVGIRVLEHDGILFVSFNHLPADEHNLLMHCMQEFLDPVDNPRYLLVKHDRLWGFLSHDYYFAIPAQLSANKKSVQTFQLLWERYIGPCDTVYTRSIEGRKVLLRARKDLLSPARRSRTRQLSKWQ